MPILVHPKDLENSASPVAAASWKKMDTVFLIGTKESEWLLDRQVIVFAKVVFIKLMLLTLVKKIDFFLYLLKNFLTSQYMYSAFSWYKFAYQSYCLQIQENIF